MPPGVGLSRFLTAGLVPLCIWGMLSALILHLIEIRSLFIQGGEDRLRLAVMAFSGGVILSQRLAATQGPEVASVYRWALGAAMALFTVYQAFAYRLPISPLVVIAANGAVFAALWWVGTRITAACSVDSDDASAAATETGILGRSRKLRREAPAGQGSPAAGGRKTIRPGGPASLTSAQLEEQWKERLSPRHPGLIIFLFSLFAIPAFGFGILLFDREAGDGGHLGAHLFVYLWCALALLFLSSFNQLAAYFDRRALTLPEVIGTTWLAVGFVAVTLVVLAAFLLPQPPSAAGGFVRERLFASYQGLESKMGIEESAVGRKPGGETGRSPGDTDGGKAPRPDGTVAESQTRTQLDRESGVDKAYVVKSESRVDAAKEGVQKIFDVILKIIFGIGAVAAVVTVIVIMMAVVSGLRMRLSSLRPLIRKRSASRKKPESRRDGLPLTPPLSSFRNPFTDGVQRDDADLVHYLWDATLAHCAESGAPCPPDETPYEYLDSHPAPLEGFEVEARMLTAWLMHADYSGRPFPDSAQSELRDYWTALQAHANEARELR